MQDLYVAMISGGRAGEEMSGHHFKLSESHLTDKAILEDIFDDAEVLDFTSITPNSDDDKIEELLELQQIKN